MEGGEGLNTPYPLYARLHSPDGKRLLVVYAASNADGTRFNALFPLLPQRGESQTIPLREPFSVFFTACERGGNKPSYTIDLFGTAQDAKELRYAGIQIG